MKSVSLKHIIVLALTLQASSVNASLVTETFQSTITSYTYPAFNLGDTFTWTVTYDDNSQRMTLYNDGANRLDDQGSGDDILNHAMCTSDYTGAEVCSQFTSDYTMFANAVYDLTQFTDVMAAAGLTGFNAIDYNKKLRFNSNSQSYYDYATDDMTFGENVAITYFSVGDPDVGLYAHTYTTFDSVLVKTTITENVPEPAVITLLAVGIAGIGVSRRKGLAHSIPL